jgi:uracil-DNA glycosylase
MSIVNINNYNYKKWNDVISTFSLKNQFPIIWKDYFNFEDKKFEQIENALMNEVKTKTIFPLPELLFNCFENVLPSNLKVVFIGQDPYIGKINNIPQAMGLSFSIPEGMKPYPPSLVNIFKNLTKFKHFIFEPTHGNLQFWANQGCLLLNSSLTVTEKSSGSHTQIWKNFTDDIITSLSDKFDNLIFVLWGNNAYEKINLIDLDKHDVIISSHPSPFSVDSTLKDYPSFSSFDHFGKINEILEKHHKDKIIWQLT